MIRAALSLVALVGALACAACDGEAEAPKPKVVASKRADSLPQWLTLKDKIEPALWLRSREVGHEVLSSDPEVDRLRRALHQTGARFFEDDRMVANRTVQTSNMLDEFGQRERYVDILTGMVDVADATPNKQMFGEMVQHYVNIRKQGKDRTAALSQLFGAYKAQNNLR